MDESDMYLIALQTSPETVQEYATFPLMHFSQIRADSSKLNTLFFVISMSHPHPKHDEKSGMNPHMHMSFNSNAPFICHNGISGLFASAYNVLRSNLRVSVSSLFSVVTWEITSAK